MSTPVVESTDTPEIRWPLPRDPRPVEADEREDTRLPTRRASREQRGARLRWGLLWLSAVLGGLCAWAWLARLDQAKATQFALERELNELAVLRAGLERAPELKAASLRIFVDKVESRKAALDKQLAGLPAESPLRRAWQNELSAYDEAKGDLDWLQPRWLQLGVVEGAKLTDEIKANEASLRPALDRFAAQSCPSPCAGTRFRPGLARGLLVELDRRLNEVRAAAAAAAPSPDTAIPQFSESKPAPQPSLQAKAAKPKPTLKVAKAVRKPAPKATTRLAKSKPGSNAPKTRRALLRDDSTEIIERHTRSMRARRRG